jgi:hypothetical protein
MSSRYLGEKNIVSPLLRNIRYYTDPISSKIEYIEPPLSALLNVATTIYPLVVGYKKLMKKKPTQPIQQTAKTEQITHEPKVELAEDELQKDIDAGIIRKEQAMKLEKEQIIYRGRRSWIDYFDRFDVKEQIVKPHNKPSNNLINTINNIANLMANMIKNGQPIGEIILAVDKKRTVGMSKTNDYIDSLINMINDPNKLQLDLNNQNWVPDKFIELITAAKQNKL